VRALATLGTAEQKTIDAVISAVAPEFYDLPPRRGKAATLAAMQFIPDEELASKEITYKPI